MDNGAHEHRRVTQVYLDTSDFSTLSNPDLSVNIREEYFARLGRISDEGRAEFRFSSVHVAECTPTRPSAVMHAAHRLLAIDRICGPKCFRFFSDVIRDELSGFTSPSISNEGHWSPETDIEKALRRTKQELIANALSYPRYQRRRLISPDGKQLKLSARDFASSSGYSDLVNEYPFLENRAFDIAEYFCGRRKLPDLALLFQQTFESLPNFAKLFEVNYDEAIKLASWLRIQGAPFVQKILDIRSSVQNGALLFDEDQFEEMITKLIQEVALSSANKLVATNAENFDSKIFEPFSSLEEMSVRSPTLHSFFCAISEVYKTTAFQIRVPLKPKPSDVGDINHSAYIPHVDFFRCDRQMAPRFQSIAGRYGTRLVLTLDELLVQLESSRLS